MQKPQLCMAKSSQKRASPVLSGVAARHRDPEKPRPAPGREKTPSLHRQCRQDAPEHIYHESQHSLGISRGTTQPQNVQDG